MNAPFAATAHGGRECDLGPIPLRQSDDSIAPRADGSRSAPRAWHGGAGGDRMVQFAAFLFCLFAVRDSMTGALRYLLSQVGLSAIWFIPDLLTFVAAGWFAWTYAYRRRSPWAILLVALTVSGTAIGWLFMASSPFALFSSIKLFLPIYIGCCLAGRSLLDSGPVRWCLTALLVFSVTGLVLNPWFEYPWVTNDIDNFGYTKEVGRMIWAGEDVRYGGFAGEATIAAFMCTAFFVLLHSRWPRWLVLLGFVAVAHAVDISTSKTSLGLLIAFGVYYGIAFFIRERDRLMALQRRLARLSFLFVPVPFVLMAILAGTDLTMFGSDLFSLQDRINNTWRFPFVWLSRHFAPGLVTGCGLGCFTYPMQYTSMAELWVPVDSFYVTSYLMLGVPFLALIAGMFTATQKSDHSEKLLLLAFINLFFVTIQGYSPSIMAIMLGYAMSDMFLDPRRNWRRLTQDRQLACQPA